MAYPGLKPRKGPDLPEGSFRDKNGTLRTLLKCDDEYHIVCPVCDLSKHTVMVKEPRNWDAECCFCMKCGERFDIGTGDQSHRIASDEPLGTRAKNVKKKPNIRQTPTNNKVKKGAKKAVQKKAKNTGKTAKTPKSPAKKAKKKLPKKSK